jgi:hypothetical protein
MLLEAATLSPKGLICFRTGINMLVDARGIPPVPRPNTAVPRAKTAFLDHVHHRSFAGPDNACTLCTPWLMVDAASSFSSCTGCSCLRPEPCNSNSSRIPPSYTSPAQHHRWFISCCNSASLRPLVCQNHLLISLHNTSGISVLQQQQQQQF